MTYLTIYGLREPDPEDANEAVTWDPRIVYIGMSDDPYRRVKEHTVARHAIVAEWQEEMLYRAVGCEGEALDPEDVLGDYPTPMSFWLHSLWSRGQLPKVIVLETGIQSREEARERERWWIAAARLLGLELFNQTGGG